MQQMRAVSLVDRLSLGFNGNMFAPAICLADVDNDGDSELVVANVNGELAIFKGGPFVDPAAQMAPWRMASDLGTIACLGVGDLLQSGQNVLVAINAIGECVVFALDHATQPPASSGPGSRSGAAGGAPSSATPFPAGLSGSAPGAPSASATPVPRSAASTPTPGANAPSTSSTSTTTTTTQASASGLSGTAAAGSTAASGPNASSTRDFPCEMVRPVMTLRVAINVKSMLIADIDGDGNNELVVGRTDRVVHAYRWEPDVLAPTTVQPPAVSSTRSSMTSVATIPPVSGGGFPSSSSGGLDAGIASLSADARIRNLQFAKGRLVAVRKWDMPGQLGSMSMSMHPVTKTLRLIISQPGGTFASIEPDGKVVHHSGTGVNTSVGGVSDANSPVDSKSGVTASSPDPTLPVSPVDPSMPNLLPLRDRDRDPLIAASMGSISGSALGASTEVAGNVVRSSGVYDPLQAASSDQESTAIAVCTLDGCLRLMDFDRILWELCVDHQLFSISTFNVTSDLPRGRFDSTIQDGAANKPTAQLEENAPFVPMHHVAACAWDGMTYIVDSRPSAIRFQFEEDVCAFAAGYFAVERGNNVPVLVYVTFSDQIYLYYNIGLESIGDRRLLADVLNSDSDRTTLNQLSAPPAPGAEISLREQYAKTISTALYGASPDELRALISRLKGGNAASSPSIE
ncbi:hypothetical protein CAOG_04407 [Capsaspora owczarzaki ATCC 30864]|uniref:Uncharacterized protein n=1 Tax=Capsaspora owczarzaki (strain ATCC 30864) TaxID=595528 RepID=A0A0D2UEY9_CAPO3|nr:hypothetical protein CAOG_04407 [Capsaspora owczarzaki ATCC 30864]KJE93651.1 hypothetical protein CAOG_004407 [Capsaspora owczarzaki ATCC 30864]|eukprot:XP_004348235.2 hypothetical protein CAOG_04407 [Capsaspora owczarzaki ATCC 30864]